MRLIYLNILLFIYLKLIYCDDIEKYHLLREQCSQLPTDSGCLQLKQKFIQLIQNCQIIQTQNQYLVCQQAKLRLCSVFPSYCHSITTTTNTSTKRKTTKKSKIKKKISKLNVTNKTTNPTIITTKINHLIINKTIENEEFSKVPLDPSILRTRGEYCIRHGKEEKCQNLLNNLKTTYSTCSKKINNNEKLDCHSFEIHLCKAFPKFPPCLKKLKN